MPRAGIKSGPPSLAAAKPEVFENETGFGMGVLIDLCKVLACFMARTSDKDGVAMSNKERLFLKAVIGCSDFSSRLTLFMRQPGPFKYLVLQAAAAGTNWHLRLSV